MHHAYNTKEIAKAVIFQRLESLAKFDIYPSFLFLYCEKLVFLGKRRMGDLALMCKQDYATYH